MKHNKNIKFYSVIISIMILFILLDQTTKILVKEFLTYGEGLAIIPNFFYLEYIHNEGAAWGMFAGNKFIILGMPLIGIVIFSYLISLGNLKTKKVYTIGLFLMIAGTIGNYLDRIILGYVIDFLSFRFGSYHFPNFNIADSCLVIGVILFATDLLILDGRRKNYNEEHYDL